ncbi:hypothetical protein FH609_023965 [Streptomyces sp. 3MP-14]|uniref:Phytanoyl-CoA dioxygenase family protein n=1 Tax=Streptomyces mimosae TaxID=2586635 RepID=A0A5N6ADZ5_9ACTN|nr:MULTISPECIES: phytanoyl-CoA dioxygenase family protein [Streptomyces]KAB8166412.1 hypothetical protein FH607_011325 [Streptomyces mimosae]KAB8174205.1 hypothetical protein FH609_023965 [Streptomyces sp. 3MP-14]
MNLQEMKANFERDGFTVIKQAIDPEEADRYRQKILKMVPADLAIPAQWESRYGRLKPLHEDGNQTFDDEFFIPVFQNETLYNVASTILGTERLRAFDGSLGITLRHDWGGSPGVRSFEVPRVQTSQRLHIDNSVPKSVDTFRLDQAEMEIGGCFYFSKVESGGGGIAVVPGGHRRVAAEAAADALGRHKYRDWGDLQGYPDPVEVTGEPGDFILLHYLTPHAATHNRNVTARVVQFLRWVRFDNPYGIADVIGPTRYNDRQIAVMSQLGKKLLGVEPWGA